MVNSRAKGADAEREVAEMLRGAGWPGAVRGQQRSGRDCADVVGGPPGYHLEIKRTEKAQVWAAREQAVRDAPVGAEPVVLLRRSRSPWLAVLDAGHLLGLLREIEQLRAAQALLGLPTE